MIYLTDQDGHEHALDAAEGWRVMEIIREYGFIQGICDGMCECATCHVYVDDPWIKNSILHRTRNLNYWMNYLTLNRIHA